MDKKIVKEQIVSIIRERIFNGRYPLGTSIPTQRELASEFKTSPTTISSSLNVLARNGLITLVPGRGTHVLSLDERPLSGAVAIFSPQNDFSNPESKSILDGISYELKANNQHFKLLNANNYQNAKDYQDVFSKYSGAIFMESSGMKDFILAAQYNKFPYVVANLEKNLDVTCTCVNHTKTMMTATDVLIALGHTQIAILSRSPNQAFYQKAINGYSTALERAGIVFDKSMIIIVDVPARDGTVAYRSIREMFLKIKNKPSAVVACRDYLAWGAYCAFQDEGLKVGKDISLIGYDNLSWPQSVSPLTTFEEPTFAMGTNAVKMLLERILSGLRDIERREIEAPLVLRRTVGPHLTNKTINSSIKLQKVNEPASVIFSQT